MTKELSKTLRAMIMFASLDSVLLEWKRGIEKQVLVAPL